MTLAPRRRTTGHTSLKGTNASAGCNLATSTVNDVGSSLREQAQQAGQGRRWQKGALHRDHDAQLASTEHSDGMPQQ